MDASYLIRSVIYIVMGYVAIVVVVAATWLLLRRILSPVYWSARRLGLRDKGEVEKDEEGGVRVHALCNTPHRIGIGRDGVTAVYCWRCEMILKERSGFRAEEEKKETPKLLSPPPSFEGEKVLTLNQFRHKPAPPQKPKAS